MSDPPSSQKPLVPTPSSVADASAAAPSAVVTGKRHELKAADTTDRPQSYLQLGHASLPVDHVRQLEAGAIVRLEQSSEEVAWLIVNGEPRAAGVLLEVDGQFAFQVTELTDPQTPRSGPLAEEGHNEV